MFSHGVLHHWSVRIWAATQQDQSSTLLLLSLSTVALKWPPHSSCDLGLLNYQNPLVLFIVGRVTRVQISMFEISLATGIFASVWNRTQGHFKGLIPALLKGFNLWSLLQWLVEQAAQIICSDQMYALNIIKLISSIKSTLCLLLYSCAARQVRNDLKATRGEVFFSRTMHHSVRELKLWSWDRGRNILTIRPCFSKGISVHDRKAESSIPGGALSPWTRHFYRVIPVHLANTNELDL